MRILNNMQGQKSLRDTEKVFPRDFCIYVYELRQSVGASLQDLKALKECVRHAKTSISGGITLESLD